MPGEPVNRGHDEVVQYECACSLSPLLTCTYLLGYLYGHLQRSQTASAPPIEDIYAVQLRILGEEEE